MLCYLFVYTLISFWICRYSLLYMYTDSASYQRSLNGANFYLSKRFKLSCFYMPNIDLFFSFVTYIWKVLMEVSIIQGQLYHHTAWEGHFSNLTGMYQSHDVNCVWGAVCLYYFASSHFVWPSRFIVIILCLALLFFMEISHLGGLCVGPMDRILVTIVISCALCGFGNVCFVRSLCHMSVQPFLTIPLFGTCPMHSVLWHSTFYCAIKHFVVVELGVLFSALSCCLEKKLLRLIRIFGFL